MPTSLPVFSFFKLLPHLFSTFIALLASKLLNFCICLDVIDVIRQRADNEKLLCFMGKWVNCLYIHLNAQYGLHKNIFKDQIIVVLRPSKTIT